MSAPLRILSLDELRTRDLSRVGGKLARLGELAARFSLPASLFFVLQHRPVTTVAAAAESAPFDPVQYVLRNLFSVWTETARKR